MSDFTDIFQKGPAAAKVERPEPDPVKDADSVTEEESNEQNRSNKKRPGRPSKGARKDEVREHAALVCYVTTSVKTTIKRIQAAQTLSSGNALTESEIISGALDLYIKHNKLDIN